MPLNIGVGLLVIGITSIFGLALAILLRLGHKETALSRSFEDRTEQAINPAAAGQYALRRQLAASHGLNGSTALLH